MNPYDPQRPSSPQAFAGRSKLLERSREFIALARARKRSGAILLHGHRGSGKTSALRKIQALVLEELPESIIAEVPLRAKSSESALLKDIVEDSRRYASENLGRAGRFKAAIERLKGVNVSLLGAGIGLTSAASGDQPSPLTLWRQLLSAVRESQLLCVCVDDAELLDRTGLGSLKTIAESVSEVPVLLVVAGGPNLVTKLAEHESSPVARVFSGADFDLEEFTAGETEEALLAPLRAEGATGGWTPEAVRRIQELSHGYPYLVKCIAFAAYREDALMSPSDVDASVQGALDVASSWLEREIPDASDLDVVAFARIAKCGKTSLRSAEILSLDVQGPYIGRLVRLGVLKKTARGHYELRKAPVIAYYHLLRRKLPG